MSVVLAPARRWSSRRYPVVPPRCLSLALDNLIDNGIAAAGSGGQVSVAITPAETHVSIQIKDTGPGLPEAVQRAAFAPVASAKPGGAGLGLALSHELLRHAGGALSLAHSDGHGTVFRATLPLAATTEKEAKRL